MIHPDWAELPTACRLTGTVWRLVFGPHGYRDAWDAYIMGKTKDKKWFWRCVRVNGQAESDRDSILWNAYQEVVERGPDVCVYVEEGGFLPTPETQPPL